MASVVPGVRVGYLAVVHRCGFSQQAAGQHSEGLSPPETMRVFGRRALRGRCDPLGGRALWVGGGEEAAKGDSWWLM